MKTLLTVLFMTLATIAIGQNPGTCPTCTTPHGIQLAPAGADLGVGWDNDAWMWESSGECTKGVSILINGVELFPAVGKLHPSYAEATIFYNVLQPGVQTCVVVRNYCTEPVINNPTNFADSAPVCYTPAGTAPLQSSAPCKENNKYVMFLDGVKASGNKNYCRQLVSQGWLSTCNCK